MVLQRLISLITNAANLRRKIAPEQALLDAKYALAERMLAAGIDDGYLGGVINSLDAEIGKDGASNMRARTLLAERRSLLLRLAEAALEFDAPLPGRSPSTTKPAPVKRLAMRRARRVISR